MKVVGRPDALPSAMFLSLLASFPSWKGQLIKGLPDAFLSAPPNARREQILWSSGELETWTNRSDE
jgi:hypothetical protein